MLDEAVGSQDPRSAPFPSSGAPNCPPKVGTPVGALVTKKRGTRPRRGELGLAQYALSCLQSWMAATQSMTLPVSPCMARHRRPWPE